MRRAGARRTVLPGRIRCGTLLALAAASLTPAGHGGGNCTGFRPTRLDTRGVPGLVSAVAVLPGDFNRDGALDVAVINKYLDGFLVDGSITVLQGDRSGLFSFSTTQVSRGGFFWAAAADFNDDGLTDVAAVNHNDALIFIGDGAGGFLPHTTIPLGFDPVYVSACDMDGDGRIDLAVVMQYIGQPGGRVRVLKGDGSGGFTLMPPATVAQSPLGGVTGDFDGDGRQDVVAGSFLSNNVAFLPGRGDGTFGPAVFSNVGSSSNFFAAADFDGDGKLDLVATSEDAVRSILVLRGAGDGTFGVTGTFTLPVNSPRNPLLCDFNRDGALDVAVPNSGSGDVAVLKGDGAGGFSAPLSVGADGGPHFGAIADVNADGLCDVLTANGGASVSALLGGPRGTLGTPVFPAGARPLGAALADFDRDGRLDAGVASRDTGAALIFRGDGEGGLVLAQSVPAGSRPGSVAAGDFNGDGWPDLAVADQGTPGDQVNETVHVLLNDGSGLLVEAHVLTVGDLPLDIEAADFNADGLSDLVVANGQGDRISFYLAEPVGGFGNVKNIRLGDPQRSLAVADFTGDGLLDVAVSLNMTNRIVLLTGSPQGSFQMGPTYDLGGTWTIGHIGTADLDGDLLPDLVAVSRPPDPFAQGEVVVLLGTGSDAGFQPPRPGVATGTLPQGVGLIDLDGSGGLDVVVANRLDNDVVLLMGDGTGALAAEPVRFGTGVGPIDLAAGDFNNDSRGDLLSVDFDGNGVSILLNNTPIEDPVGPVVFAGTHRLVWDPLPGASAYNVYRDPMEELSFDSFGRCAASGLLQPELEDAAEPGPGQALFYLVTGVVSGSEIPLGYTSTCLKRANVHPCAGP